MPRLVVFDMDGVLADVESSWVFVHDHFSVDNNHSLDAYLRGEIDDHEFIRRDIQLWRTKRPGLTSRDIGRILDEVPTMPGASRTIDELRQRGYRTAIVSAGIDILAERIAEELGIDMQLSNGLTADGAGVLSGEGTPRVKVMDKGAGVDEVARCMGASKDDIVSVGNSRYDVPMFRRSRKGIAFCPSDDFVRDEADAVVTEKDLSLILEHVLR